MTTTVICRCPLCGTISHVTCDADAYDQYVTTRTPIQEIFPEMGIHIRELLISGMCLSCQAKFFVEDEFDCPYDGECETCPHEECPC